MSLIGVIYTLFKSTKGWSLEEAGLKNADQLDAAIRQERSRADRTGGEFSAIIFFTPTKSTGLTAFLPLIQHLQRRSRCIDLLSWSRENHLWFLLPSCPVWAADQIATQLCEQFSTDRPIHYRLYHYSADLPAANEAPAIPSQPPHASSRRAPCSFGDYVNRNLAAHRPSQVPWAEPMEVMLAQPMPLWKRGIDILASLLGLILLAPLLGLISVAVKVTSPGPVLFAQRRTGRAGKPFTMYKFRSMVVDAEARKLALLNRNEQDGPAFKMENDPRVTRVGRWLRALSLDELPQLWNVLRGDMSLVGPRPLPISENEACEGWQRQRLDVTPGLTCFWQIKDRRNKIPFVDWARMDIRYAASRSLLLDLRLIAQTILFVIRRKGV